MLILAAIGVFIFCELPGIANAPKASAADSTTIQIEGHQFYWLFRYPNGAVSIDRMVAPADQVVHEEVIGLDFDVNHSWWVPELGGKYDAIPGKTNKTWFEAPVGTYVARCSELCGMQHALMTAVVDVVPRAAVRPVHRDARLERRPGSRSARKSSRASARSATGSTTSTSARRSAATRCSPTARASSRCSATARGRCPPSARTGRAPRSTP